MIHPLRPAIPVSPARGRAWSGGPRAATPPPPPRRLHATAGSAAPTRARCAPSPTCPPATRGPRLSPTVPGGGQPKATREALCLACRLPAALSARPSSRAPSTTPDAMGAPAPR
ncbi:hypothetical protein GQ55_2G368100 [Panicum hallii var. hallii]|uniref:Uncharacterized protein n=2 Tax=Panicum hallii TaxID=206008 RepID=A0A2T7EWB7_9POAL|nr:hypothetical protein GQ55_2G368100 [Panicum hallii var. hallii]PVH64899.1 hypothetical protein PAHAL_2G378900 [Panicum hallii]